MDKGPAENEVSESTVSGSVVQAGSVGGPVVIGERNIIGDHNQLAGYVGVLVGAGGQAVLAPVTVPAMESVPAIAGLGRVPAGQAVFVGRSEELSRLDAAVARTGRAAVVAVHGLGGVGKSTLAARFTERHADRFSLVWWMIADSPTAIATGLAELAVAVAPQTAELPSEQRTELGVRWLATHRGWLLVLDNLTSPQDAAELLARVHTGTVVITSRQGTGWHAVAETVPLDVLRFDEAIDLMTRIIRADQPEADLTGVDRVCAELGWLPLAVEQAAASIAQTRITPAAYLDLLARFPARMFTTTGEGGDARRTMARVWHVTLDRLTDTPLAGWVLRQLAWYAPDSISRSLLAGTADEPDLLDALGRLAAYSMITLTTDTIGIHRVVQAVTRTPDPADPHRQPKDVTTARDAATTSLTTVLDGHDHRDPVSWPHYQAVLPHAQALLNHTAPDTHTPSTCSLLNQLGLYLADQGNIATAITYFTRASLGYEDLLGPDHRDTLGARNNLASAYESVGDLGRAIPLLESTLVDRERVLGADHPDTLTSRNNLAYAYESVGDLGRAVPLLESTLVDSERVLGADHPDTLLPRTNLALAYRSAGDLGRAFPLFESTLVDSERVLGADHPDTLCSRSNLASAYRSMGDLGRAIPLFEAVLADRERVLGADHPSTLLSRNNLASAYESAGDLGQAFPLFESALADRERVLGADHPSTLHSRNNLANAYRSAGDLVRAIPLYKAALADCERVLGHEHPKTRLIRSNLASLND